MYDADEVVDIHIDEKKIFAISPRGALLIENNPGIGCVAYEDLSPCLKSWSQSIDFCIPEAESYLTARDVLTELGTDQQSPVESAYQEILFDLGLASTRMQFCVRTDNEELLNLLRKSCGTSVFEHGNPVLMAIQEASPVRVIISVLARIEISGAIQTTESGVPCGPHTHLIPGLLNTEKQVTHSLPGGYTSALTLSPVHPLFDKYGIPKMFDRTAYDDFQSLLTEFGIPEYYAEKSRISDAISGSDGPELLKPGPSSWQHLAHQMLCLQLPHIGSS